ncbi:MAG: glycerol-3-phosphate 1-O-acyltransferase PlsY [bacterium]|jgi:glycerol-3-phosphate acyltransferase PlsY|nr:glycerol-3-phosphate 1-O-acyltransferase PlsY [candidate division KSB1 bacterium]MDH7560923.1 glycerol-3-phosphate 1-O-acyltransferase PlsY [bacterium]
MLNLPIVMVLSYLAGSVPTSIIVSRLFRGIDIRDYGSGNAGATNVLRVLGWRLALLVMIVDVGKGFVAARFIAPLAFAAIPGHPALVQILAGTSAVVGHIYTVFAGFRGGKGVGTGAGVMLALYPLATLICAVVFFAVAFATRYVSLASLTAVTLLPALLVLFRAAFHWPADPYLLVFAALVAALIVFAHRSNIRRLLAGTENRFGSKRQDAQTAARE